MNEKELQLKLKSIDNRTDEYSFLASDENLGDNIVLLGYGGSYAYGTNNEDSDLDIRGIALNTKRNLILSEDFEQVVELKTDTTIYSFDKMIKLLCSCNPNTIEILGLPEGYYVYLDAVGREILDNKRIFLSKVAASTFGGYANAQLRRLENKAARVGTQTSNETNILKSIENASVDYKRRYFHYTDDEIKLYVDESHKSEYDSEIYMDLNLKHYPLRDFNSMMNDMTNILKGYSKINGRNKHAIEHGKLGKHMMHLVRLYFMCFDILEKGEINTYRENELDLLIDIRNGKYLDEKRQPIPEFYEVVDMLDDRLKYDKENTDLPDKPNMDEVKDFVVHINDKYVLNHHQR